MDWMETVVHTTTMGADLVSDVLMGAGAVGTSIEDRFDVTSSKKSDGMWDMIDEDVLRHMSEDVLVKAYFEQGPSAQEALHLLRQKLQELSREEMGFDIERFRREAAWRQKADGRCHGRCCLPTPKREGCPQMHI